MHEYANTHSQHIVIHDGLNTKVCRAPTQQRSPFSNSDTCHDIAPTRPALLDMGKKIVSTNVQGFSLIRSCNFFFIQTYSDISRNIRKYSVAMLDSSLLAALHSFGT